MARKRDSKITVEANARPLKQKLTDPKTASHMTAAIWDTPSNSRNVSNPWRDAPYKREKSGSLNAKGYEKVVEECRYFYRKDPIASTTINKLVEIGINDLIIDKGSLSENQYRMLDGLRPQIIDFLQEGAQEFLVSGLVVPSITFEWKNKSSLENMGVKKYSKAWLPKDMWYRNPKHIELKESFVSREPRYYINIPQEYLKLLQKSLTPTVPEDSKDISDFLTSYPGFVEQIKAGSKKLLLNDEHHLFIEENQW